MKATIERKNKKDKIIKPQPGFQEAFAASSVDVVFGGGILAAGKLGPLSSHVLTPDGWSEMRDIKVGSTIVTPFDGNAMVTAVFPQGVKPIYKVEFTDGRVAECGLEHLWTVRTFKQLHKYNNNGKPWKWTTTLTTEDIIKGMNEGKKYYVPMPHAVEFKEQQPLPIPPYILGVMIGDGCLTDPRELGCFKISNTEEDIINKVAYLSETKRIYRQPHCHTKYFYTDKAKAYRDYLHKVGLNTYSYNKFIPTEYLFASVEHRRELLAGLFDTDGSVDKRNCFKYSTTSKRLKDDFVHLCRSLGYITHVTKDKRVEKYTSGVAYEIKIRTDEVFFTSQKHLSRVDHEYNATKSYSRSSDHACIKSITYDRNEEAQCILVDDEKHLYICDDFVTTHNSYGLILAMAGPLMLDGDFRAMISRRNIGSLKAGGGFSDTFKDIFGSIVQVRQSDSPRVSFPSGAFCDLTYIDDSNIDKLRERAKGWQYDMIAMDELTEMSWEAFSYIMTRNRGRSKTFTGKFFATMNPKRSHWVRTFIDWYIGLDGYIRPDRDGKIRYFYVTGSDVKDVAWGDTKEEVYRKCKVDIDRKLAKIGGDFSYKDMIKSFVFYKGALSENKALTDGNSGYIGSVAASGGKTAQQLVEGNWNVDPEEDDDIPIPSESAREVFVNDPAVNGDRWITVDLADYGTDNLVALEWNGFHIVDYRILSKSTPRQNAEFIKSFAVEKGINESRIIYDATSGRYFNDYVPEAIPYISSSRARGLYQLKGSKLKDLCYLRLCRMINRGQLTMADNVANSTYKHQNLKYTVTLQTEFLEECSVVRFKEMGGGRKQLLSKKEMNAKLGKNRSMDLLDPCAMRMMPCVDMEYGTELEQGFEGYGRDEDESHNNLFEYENTSIYDDAAWY